MSTLRNLGLTTTLFLFLLSACQKDNLHPLVERTIGSRDFNYTFSEIGFTYDSLGNPIDFGPIPGPEIAQNALFQAEPDNDDGILLSGLLRIPYDSITAEVDGDTLRIASQICGYSSGGAMYISGKLFWEADSLIVTYNWTDPGWWPEPDAGGVARGSAK